MTRLLSFTLVLLVLSPLVSSAEQVCPWLNSATAEAALGGPVTANVTLNGKTKEDGVCEFTRTGPITYKLRVEVTTLAKLPADFTTWLAQCGPKSTPLRGIGNHAVDCDLTEPSEVAAQVLGRARERAFLVRVITNNKSTRLEPLREQASSIAEQVAGNLF